MLKYIQNKYIKKEVFIPLFLCIYNIICSITKADHEARKSDDLLKRDFKSSEPLKKAVTEISEIKAKDGKLYVSAIFDCFDLTVLSLPIDTNMK